jgi:hypothetical protein
MRERLRLTGVWLGRSRCNQHRCATEQPKHRPSVVVSTLQDVIVGEPKAASQEGAFVPGQTVDLLSVS